MQICVLLLILFSILCHQKIKGYFVWIEELGCHNTEFRLSCELLNGNIAIFQATFSSEDSFLGSLQPFCENLGHSPNSNTTNKYVSYQLKSRKDSFHQQVNLNGFVNISFRHAINRRCSGINYCSFVLVKDFEEAPTLGPGVVYLRYACVNDAYSTIACNANLSATAEGFVRTPGYPDYYTGETTCMWTLTAPSPQKVRVTFLDVSLRGLAPYEVSCLDWLIVAENGLNLLSTCGDIVEDTSILSHESSLNVTFKSSSKTLFPKRGLLFYYKAVGCPSLQKPKDGYLINKNETYAHYRCCVGFIFPDTLTRDKILKCYNENSWDGVVLDCVNVTKKSTAEFAIAARNAMEKSDFLKDIIMPSIVMGILFIGNGIVLYLIYRQRKKLTAAEKMEMSNLHET